MIHVLRLGHRRARDARLTTHVVLTARAFGANAVTVTEPDADLERTIGDVVERFGGPFEFKTGASWKSLVQRWKARGGLVLHLTMYGEALEPVVSKVRDRDVLVVVGSEKVPGDLYRLADYNVAVGNQPHSEVAALSIALDRLTGGAWARRAFAGKLEVVPNPRGKTLIERPPSAPSTSRRTRV